MIIYPLFIFIKYRISLKICLKDLEEKAIKSFIYGDLVNMEVMLKEIEEFNDIIILNIKSFLYLPIIGTLIVFNIEYI